MKEQKEKIKEQFTLYYEEQLNLAKSQVEPVSCLLESS